MKQVILKPKKEAPVRRFNPWIFSGAIARKEGDPVNGDTVEVYTKNGQYLATGHYQDASISVRIFSFEQQAIDTDFWIQKLQNAYNYRQTVQLTMEQPTNCYRLVHGEGDGLPGLIIDIYGSTAVIQCHSIGMHRHIGDLAAALQAVYGDDLKTIFDKSAETLPNGYAQTMENKFLLGTQSEAVVKENGRSFFVNWTTGQKTGFFIDQRDNRALLGKYVEGKSVLNAFCYSGGFSVYALQAGAKSVDSVDVSKRAMEWTNQNVELNAGFSGTHEPYTADVLKFLKERDTMYEVAVIDPPAFAKSIKKRHNAVQGYKRLNILAMNRVVKGGLLFTFSCSQVVDQALFENTIVAAALEVGRPVRVMHRLSQAADHPVSIFHSQSSYLKGLVVQLD